MNPEERQQEEDEIRQDLENLILHEARKRPITDDEATVLLWHCGLMDTNTRARL